MQSRSGMIDSEFPSVQREPTSTRASSILPTPDDVARPWPQSALPSVSLGAWGLAHLAGGCAGNGRPRLIGRELELLRMLRAIDQTIVNETPTIVTISGPSGIGKTRL